MKEKNRKHSFSDDIITDLDAVGIATLIKKKEISAVEVTNACIARAQKVNPFINAIVTENFEASKKLAESQKFGFFQGVPLFLKDMTFVEGIPTYFGSKAFSNAKPATKTDEIAKQIFAQGFVNLGTSTLPEFGFTATTEFQNGEPTRNPWNLNHSCGGSSGGSAALVAAGVVPIAHAADGGGSIRIPAACCGLVGLKPQRGRLLFSEVFRKQIVEIAVDGVLTRTVRDTAHFYAEAEKYYKNPNLQAIGLVEGPSNRKFKIGYTSNSIKNYKSDQKTNLAIEKTAKLLAGLGHEVKEIVLPINDQIHDDFANFWYMGAFLTHKFGGVLIKNEFDKSGLSKLTLGLSNRYLKNILKTPFFINRLKKTYFDYQKILKDLDIDFLLTPTVSHTTPAIGVLGINQNFDEMFEKVMNWSCFTAYANACGCPAISLPIEHDFENDLPIGLMFLSNHGLEKDLFDIAYQLEASKSWKKIYE